MANPMRDTWPRWFARPTVPWVLLLVALAAGATPKVVGDGGEYFVYAVAMARGQFPPLAPEDLRDAKSVLEKTEWRFDSWDPARSTVVNASGNGDFVHFWLYPAIAAPGVFLTRLAGISPAWSFAFVNVVFLTLAWRLSVARFGWAVSLLVFGGPVLWWVDKVHTEAFTFSLLTIAVASLSSRPWLSLAALGAAATQNPPIAALLLPFGLAGLWIKRGRRDWRATAIGLAGGAMLAAVHPLYYLAVHGQPSLIATASRGVVPNLSEFGAVLWDTNLGLAFGHPLFVLAFAGSAMVLLARNPRASFDAELLAAGVAVPMLLLAFSQTTNFQHGGTPGMSRYALWLLPFSLRLFDLARVAAGTDAWTGRWAMLSFGVCLVAYHPSVAEAAYRPSYATRWLWSSAPGLVTPLPEVFSETVHGDDRGVRVPVALPGCEKVLMQAGDSDWPMWPVPCYPAPIPQACKYPGTICYATRTARGYTFDTVPRSGRTPVRHSSSDAWGLEAEPAVRRLLDGADWPSLRIGSRSGGLRYFRHAENVAQVWDLQSEHALVLVAKGARPGARAFVRLPRRMEGPIVDGESGVDVGHAAVMGEPSELTAVPLPEGSRLLLVVLR